MCRKFVKLSTSVQIAVFITAIAFIFQILVIVLPFWSRFKEDLQTYSGLWFVCDLSTTTDCWTRESQEDWLSIVRSLAVCSAIFLVLVLMGFLVYTFIATRHVAMHKILASSLFAIDALLIVETVLYGILDTSGNLHIAFYTSIFVSIIVLIAALLLLVGIPSDKRINPLKSGDTCSTRFENNSSRDKTTIADKTKNGRNEHVENKIGIYMYEEVLPVDTIKEENKCLKLKTKNGRDNIGSETNAGTGDTAVNYKSTGKTGVEESCKSDVLHIDSKQRYFVFTNNEVNDSEKEKKTSEQNPNDTKIVMPEEKMDANELLPNKDHRKHPHLVDKSTQTNIQRKKGSNNSQKDVYNSYNLRKKSLNESRNEWRRTDRSKERNERLSTNNSSLSSSSATSRQDDTSFFNSLRKKRDSKINESHGAFISPVSNDSDTTVVSVVDISKSGMLVSHGELEDDLEHVYKVPASNLRETRYNMRNNKQASKLPKNEEVGMPTITENKPSKFRKKKWAPEKKWKMQF